MEIKFTGKFTDLKKMGYKFHKLFANNYKVYIKDGILIWVEGRDVEFRNIDHSAKIAKMIFDDTYPVYKEDINYKGPHNLYAFLHTHKKGEPLSCVINNETGEVTTNAEFVKKHGYNYNHDIHQELHVNMKLIEAVHELKDMIKIEGAA